MKQPRRLLQFAFYLLFIARAIAADEPVKWEIRAQNPLGEIEYDPQTGFMSSPNGVIITYGSTVLTANKVTADDKTGEVWAQGAVTIKGQGQLWTGDSMVYNFKTGKMESDAFKTGKTPFFISGQGLAMDRSNHLYSATNSIITTDDYADPSYKIRARRLVLVPDDYFEAEHATFYVADVPVMYLPHYRRSLKRHPNNFEFYPGYRSLYGPYLLSTYNWYASSALHGGVHFDLRERRGLAAGPDFFYNVGKYGKGELEYYFADDARPGEDFIGNKIPEHRQRLRFLHRIDFDTNTVFKTAIRYQSDPLVVRDFFESEYRENVQPSSFAEFTHSEPNWVLDAIVQPRVNDFFETVERLPDLRLMGLRQQIGDTPLYYDSDSSAGYFQRRFASTNEFQPDFAAFRGDTYHQITLPQTYFGWLNFTPRAGGRVTYYSEADGRGATTDEETRGVFNTGAELSFKASQIWSGATNHFLDVNGLRHIIEPSINYTYVPDPTVRPRDLPQFDYELPSLRLLPIEFPDYNAIDSIDTQNVLRLGLRNKLQTKRAGGIENLVNWALYTDWRLQRHTNQTRFADLFSDLDFRPRSWLVFNSEMRYATERARLHQANHRMTLLPNDTWSLTLGHWYLDTDPALGLSPIGDNLFYDSFYYRINENWGWHMQHYYQALDGRMQEQYYTIYRDLRSWTAALTIRFREQRSGANDFTIAVTFSLKAFPRFKVNQDRDRPWMLLGY